MTRFCRATTAAVSYAEGYQHIQEAIKECDVSHHRAVSGDHAITHFYESRDSFHGRILC